MEPMFEMLARAQHEHTLVSFNAFVATLDGILPFAINRPPTGGDLTFSWKKGHI